MDIGTLGLKSCYAFKETHIPSSLERDRIHATLKDTIAPAIRDLECRHVINGFHYIVHSEIDLRISCNDWDRHLPTIKEVLCDHSIPADLHDWNINREEMSPDDYGGETGLRLCYNNLELNSRLCLALVELTSESHDGAVHQSLAKLCPHQWVHYLCNQFGYLNLDQAVFEMNDAFTWLDRLMSTNQDDLQVVESVRTIVRQFREATRRFEEHWLNG